MISDIPIVSGSAKVPGENEPQLSLGVPRSCRDDLIPNDQLQIPGQLSFLNEAEKVCQVLAGHQRLAAGILSTCRGYHAGACLSLNRWFSMRAMCRSG